MVLGLGFFVVAVCFCGIFVVVVFFLFVFVFLRQGCPGTRSVDQASLRLRNLPASAS